MFAKSILIAWWFCTLVSVWSGVVAYIQVRSDDPLQAMTPLSMFFMFMCFSYNLSLIYKHLRRDAKANN